MKNKFIKVIIFVFFLFLVLFLFLLTPDGQYYSFLFSWQIGKPDTYYMEILVRDNYEESRWAVTVQNNMAVDVVDLEGQGRISWLHKYGFTIEDMLKAGRDYCFPFECQIDIDETNDYPRILVFEGRGFVIYEFRACDSLDDCKNIE